VEVEDVIGNRKVMKMYETHYKLKLLSGIVAFSASSHLDSKIPINSDDFISLATAIEPRQTPATSDFISGNVPWLSHFRGRREQHGVTNITMRWNEYTDSRSRLATN